MPVYAKIEDSIKETIRQHMDENPKGVWDDHYTYTAWAYKGLWPMEDPILKELVEWYDGILDVLKKQYSGVELGELVKLIGEVIADNEYSYLKAWGAIEVYEHIPDYPDC